MAEIKVTPQKRLYSKKKYSNMEQTLVPESMVTIAAMIGFIIGMLFVMIVYFISDMIRRKKRPLRSKRDEEIIANVKEISESFNRLENLVLPRE